MTYIANFKAIFFDFDGVIKESVEVKADAFYDLFLPFGIDLASKVKAHHEDNGGMSRYEKLPLYLKWSEQSTDDSNIEKYAEQFSKMVTQCVIDSPWVCGVLNYLQRNQEQSCYLISATPQKEIEKILESLDIDSYFDKVVGSPTKKDVAVTAIMTKKHLNSPDCIMIGDAISDYDAAQANNINFVLRKTKLNRSLQAQLGCEMIEDFCHG